MRESECQSKCCELVLCALSRLEELVDDCIVPSISTSSTDNIFNGLNSFQLFRYINDNFCQSVFNYGCWQQRRKFLVSFY